LAFHRNGIPVAGKPLTQAERLDLLEPQYGGMQAAIKRLRELEEENRRGERAREGRRVQEET
jgi:hypothetical protein